MIKKILFSLAAGLVLNVSVAATFEEDLQTMWEVLWDERGTINAIYKWEKNKPIYYRITGTFAAADKAHVEKAINDTIKLTGVQFTLPPSEMADKDLPLEIRFIEASSREIPENNGCQANNLMSSNWKFQKRLLYVRNGFSFICAHGAMMHTMGLPGHPEGKTVLTYFPWRRDQYLRLDELMLKAWYHDAVAFGATPFEILKAFAQALEDDNEYGHSKAEYAAKKQAFFAKTLATMEAFSFNKAEVPTVIIQSGRLVSGNVKTSRQTTPHFIGMNYLNGTLGEKNLVKAQEWLEIAAKRGFLLGSLELARGHGQGRFGAASVEKSALWFGITAKLNPNIKANQTAYDTRMKTLSDAQQAAIKAQVEAFTVETEY